jgi:hypothetical protein
VTRLILIFTQSFLLGCRQVSRYNTAVVWPRRPVSLAAACRSLVVACRSAVILNAIDPAISGSCDTSDQTGTGLRTG